jgi:hypothetical protein
LSIVKGAPVVTMRSIIALHTAPSIPGGSKPWYEHVGQALCFFERQLHA